eukprot:CAMPEP_0119313218 /NCGR_PEP_ID=MMETSP1333-20130426/28301_1 /TAXON_ID=418940 /ORGANISM="Scyphosphaera apsteinii, Strain RCC1455" /LENGTH=244 /DNA_ID=CAMNT_0007318005 /DNA_START=26 /DNA_END=760 /DNA_ORIENTATION=+
MLALVLAAALAFLPAGLRYKAMHERAAAFGRVSLHRGQSVSSSLSMLLELPLSPRSPRAGLRPVWPGTTGSETLWEGDARIDFHMKVVHLTKRRISGGISVDAPAESLWSCLTAFERFPDFIPSIVSNVVTRRPDGSASIEQVATLSRRLNLQTHMTLEALPDSGRRHLVLRRTAGHGFLEFDALYTLSPLPTGGTYLAYKVDLTPCPIFPLPLVERKIRKEVPKMLVAMRNAARQGKRAAGST